MRMRMCWETHGASVSAGAVNLDFQLRVERSQITTEDRNRSFTPQDLFYARESVAGSRENNGISECSEELRGSLKAFLSRRENLCSEEVRKESTGEWGEGWRKGNLMYSPNWGCAFWDV